MTADEELIQRFMEELLAAGPGPDDIPKWIVEREVEALLRDLVGRPGRRDRAPSTAPVAST